MLEIINKQKTNKLWEQNAACGLPTLQTNSIMTELQLQVNICLNPNESWMIPIELILFENFISFSLADLKFLGLIQKLIWGIKDNIVKMPCIKIFCSC